MTDDLGDYEDEVKGLEFLAGVNDVIERHKSDPTPRPHRIHPDHPDMVQHDDAPGFWHPDVTPEERRLLVEEMQDLKRHNDTHGKSMLYDDTCRWCEQSRELNRCLYPGCKSSWAHEGTHDMYPGWH